MVIHAVLFGTLEFFREWGVWVSPVNFVGVVMAGMVVCSPSGPLLAFEASI